MSQDDDDGTRPGRDDERPTSTGARGSSRSRSSDGSGSDSRSDSPRGPRSEPTRGSRGAPPRESRGGQSRRRGSRNEPSQGSRGSSRRDSGAHHSRGGRAAPPEGEDFGKVAKGSVHGPEVDRDAVIGELDHSVRRELSSLPGTLAEKVAGHLIMAARLLDDDPELALAHARTAHDLAPRIVAVREALAIASYHGGDYRTALREARTVRRMAGDDSWLPMIADCERGLGRPEKALDLIAEADLSALPDDVRAECLMVASGARGDIGQKDAAVAVLDNDLLRSRQKSVWSARYRLAFSDALAAAGRTDEAQRWLALAAASDPTGSSAAAARISGADDLELFDVLEASDGEESDSD